MEMLSSIEATFTLYFYTIKPVALETNPVVKREHVKNELKCNKKLQTYMYRSIDTYR